MSASYSLHVAPYANPGDPKALDQASLVRDGFAGGAFLVPPLWFFAHRHWILALIVALVLSGFWGALWALGLPGGVIALLTGLLCFLIGLESSTLRRADYDRQGRSAVDVVFAASEAEAEAKSFARWLGTDQPVAGRAQAPAQPSMLLWPRRAEPEVIGLFPDRERGR